MRQLADALLFQHVTAEKAARYRTVLEVHRCSSGARRIRRLGTTPTAREESGRVARAYRFDPVYCSPIVADDTGARAMLIANGKAFD